MSMSLIVKGFLLALGGSLGFVVGLGVIALGVAALAALLPNKW